MINRILNNKKIRGPLYTFPASPALITEHKKQPDGGGLHRPRGQRHGNIDGGADPAGEGLNMKTQKTILYLGLNDKDTKTQKIEILEAYKITQNIILRYTGGATIYAADGIYTHDDGTIVIEKTLRIELFDTPAAAVADIVQDLKKSFNQESIIVSQEITDTVFM